MTRKDHRVITKSIHNGLSRDANGELAPLSKEAGTIIAFLCHELKKDNPAFNSDKFKLMCWDGLQH
jgi:hypothetical protein